MEYQKIPLKKILEHIPSILHRKLERLGLDTIGDVNVFDADSLTNLKGMGLSTINAVLDLKKTIELDRDTICATFERNDEMEIPQSDAVDGFNLFKVAVHEYLSLGDNGKNSDIVRKRYGIEGEKCYSLEELGVFYGITRERVRQIQKKHVDNFRALISGTTLVKINCRMKPDVTTWFKGVRRTAIEESILLDREIHNLVTDNDGDDEKETKSYLHLLCDLIEGKQLNLNGRKIYIFDNSIDTSRIDSATKIVRASLVSEIIPIRFFDLVLKANKIDKRLDQNYSRLALKILERDIEILGEPGEKKYQIRLPLLSSLSDYSYRILFENQEPMHFDEIWREIQHRLVRNDVPNREHQRSLKGQLVSDTRFSPIGRSGYWGLSNWDNSSETIIELAVRCIYFHNQPCSLDTIEKFVSEHRPQVRKASIISILGQNLDRVIRLKDGSFILSEWQNSYSADIADLSSQRRIDDRELFVLLDEVFKEYGADQIAVSRLIDLLKQKGIQWKPANFYQRLDKAACLEKVGEGKGSSYKYLEDVSVPSKKGKLVQLRNQIRTFISESADKELPLGEITAEFQKRGYSKPSIYGVITQNSSVFTKREKNKRKYVSLESLPSRAEQLSQEENLRKLIAGGESDSLEFKSSLRWDIRERKVNNNLVDMIVKTIAAFLNSKGGTLLIGIDDEGLVLGLEMDIQFLKKKNTDGFLLDVNSILQKYFGKQVFANVECNIRVLDEKDICQVLVKPSSRPIFVRIAGDKSFFIRASASVQKLDIEDTTSYVQTHW